jgi:dienelactone hydrolase
MKKYLLCLALLVPLAAGAQHLDVLGWKTHTTLYNFLTERMHAQYVHRDSVLAQAIGARHLSRYREACRRRYLSLIGNLPRKTALDARVTGTLTRDGYRIEKVIYQSFPGHHVTANLYIPRGKGPFPGVLFFCGHEATAKATLTYQQTCILFAKHGFVVLSIDPISQGERYQLTDAEGRPLDRGGTTAHTLLASGSNLVGTSVVAYQLWDNERGLDYLCSRSEVDTSRLGCLGNSGGGTQTAYFLPYDPRIKVAAVCSYVTRRERTLELLGPQDGCQWLPAESRAGLDISDYLIMFSPKPVLILAGRYGFVDFNGTRDVYRELSQVYATLGEPEKVKLSAWDDGHGIQIPKQQAAVQWFRRWLYHDASPVKEGRLSVLSEKQLDATRTGQVATQFKNEVPVQTRNLALAQQWEGARRRLLENSTRPAYRRMLQKVLHLDTARAPVDTQSTGTFAKSGYRFRKLILRTKDAPPLPCYLAYLPAGKKPVRTVVVLDAEGKSSCVQNDTLLTHYLRAGCNLLLADLRGTGETADDPAFNDSKYRNREYRDATLALFSGVSLPAQRTRDIRTLMEFIRSEAQLKAVPVEIDASGPDAEAALFAAALDSRIGRLRLSATVGSFLDILEHPLMKDQYSYVVPAALHYFDLPDLVTFIGPDKITYPK